MNIGLFFGSFNPIHIGHTAIANYIIEFGGLDKLWFVISPHNPFKDKANLIDDHLRLEMVNRAIKDDPRFSASDVEFSLPKPSYTINTLNKLKELYPNNRFTLIIGSDNYDSLHKWKDYNKIAEEYEFMVYPRPGFDCKQINLKGKFSIINAPQIEISSSFIRESIAAGKDIKYFLNTEVYMYIKELNLYR